MHRYVSYILSFCLIVGMRIYISGVASLPCIAGSFMIKILKERESGYQLMTLLGPIWVAQPTPLVTGVLVYEPKLGLVAHDKALFLLYMLVWCCC